jgi:hypothetical protein
MNGGLTYKDLDAMKRKAKVLDEIREWLRGRIDSEKLIAISDLIERAYTEIVRR